MIRNIQDKIIQLKKEKGICILAHSYMPEEICEVADFIGDSYALSVKAKDAKEETIIMCGVRFMAETAKILSPQKKVYLANPLAGCPMAEQMDKDYIMEIKKVLPGYAVAAYVNTTASLKTIADVCVTSSSAVKICKELPEDKILFIPDMNLGSYVQSNVPYKDFYLLKGGCPIHGALSVEEVLKAKQAHPGALLLVHPECSPEVCEMADYIGSTFGIMKYAKTSEGKEFIIGTENSIVEHLQIACPDKAFYPVSPHMTCSNMKVTTLNDILACIEGKGGDEIILDDETISKARKSIDKMIEYGG